MFFVISLVLLWAMSIMILALDFKCKTEQWASAITFFLGLRYLAKSINILLVPQIKYDSTNMVFNMSDIEMFTNILSALSFAFYPYLLLMFSLQYTNFFCKRKNQIKYLLLIPVILIYIDHPKDFNYLTLKDCGYIIIWNSVGIILSNLFLMIFYFRCNSVYWKRETFKMVLIILPSTTAGWLINFILPSFSIYHFMKYNILLILIFITSYFWILSKYGIRGKKLCLQSNQLDSKMKSVNLGTQILSHTIKNEVLKISICSRNIKLSERAFNSEDFNKYIGRNTENIVASTEYIINWISRIKDCVTDFEVKVEYNNLSDIIENVLNQFMIFFKEKEININRSYSYGQYGVFLKCDSLHIQEVFSNIIKNAFEAVEKNGEIHIQIHISKRYLIVEVRDNGIGIPYDRIDRVFEPFVTTKENRLNFGMGLTYCYNVMQKHGGTIDIKSIESKGTSVFLKFPAKLVESPNVVHTCKR